MLGRQCACHERYLFTTAQNLGFMSGMMNDFFDRTYYAVMDRVVGRPYATLICADSDGEECRSSSRSDRRRFGARSILKLQRKSAPRRVMPHLSLTILPLQLIDWHRRNLNEPAHR